MKVTNIDDYISQFPKETQAILKMVRKAISETSEDLAQGFAYGIPTFRYKGKNLVHFAGFKNHIGFYPSPSGIAAFKEDLKKYKWARGSVQFPLSEPIPLDLIKRVTEFRIAEIDKS